MRARSRILLAFAAVTALAMLAVGTLPAGAAPGTSLSVTTVSPKLKFPCDAASPIAALATFQAWANGGNMPGLDCLGTLHTTNPPLVNTVTVTTVGSDFSLTGEGQYGETGSGYNYAEPCVDGFSGSTGEAYGTLRENLSTATGTFGTNTYTGAATMYANFYWSRVGVTAITGLGTVKVIAGSNERVVGKTAYAYDTVNNVRKAGKGDAQTGVSLSVFDVTPSQFLNGCASTNATTNAGDIQITSTNAYASAS